MGDDKVAGKNGTFWNSDIRNWFGFLGRETALGILEWKWQVGWHGSDRQEGLAAGNSRDEQLPPTSAIREAWTVERMKSSTLSQYKVSTSTKRFQNHDLWSQT